MIEIKGEKDVLGMDKTRKDGSVKLKSTNVMDM
jgi:hypothetical protein